jgi:hypothetical protein
MPVVGTPVAVVASASLDSTSVRMFLRDYSNKNPLLADVEFSDDEIDSALLSALDHANAIGRPTDWNLLSFPNKYVLQMGTVSYLLKSEAFRQLRNQASYQDGNIQPVGVDDKQAGYAQLAGMLAGEFVQLVTSLKIAANMQSRAVSSPLRNIGSWRYR